MKFRGLRAVSAVVEMGSVNKAANQLCLSQPALSRTVKIIEDELELPLFKRESSGMIPTRFCRILAARIARLEKHLQAAATEIEGLGGPTTTRGGLSNLCKNITNRQLETLIEVTDCKSVGYAAQKLGLTRPAVSRSLRELEQLVGQPLVRRLPREITPTASGEVLIRRGKLALAEIRYARDELAATSGTVSGRIIIGTLPLSRTMLVPRAIACLSRDHPNLNFSTVDSPYDELLAALRCGDVDMIIGALRNPPPVDDVVEEALFRDSLTVVARAGHPFTERAEITIDEIAEAEWIVPRHGTPTRRHFEALFQRSGLPVPTHIVESSSLVTIRSLLMESDKIALISRSQVFYEERLGLLSVLPIALTHTERPIGITLRADAFLTLGVELFITNLRRICASYMAE